MAAEVRDEFWIGCGQVLWMFQEKNGILLLVGGFYDFYEIVLERAIALIPWQRLFFDQIIFRGKKGGL
jgi:hypothetical protein